jgi:uncharacterized membrane protein YkvA (DUF1232 family)
MNELNNRCLDTFPEWLRTLAADAAEMAKALAAPGALVNDGGSARLAPSSAPIPPEPALRYIVGGLNYLFKSLDLIPDGIEDLGFLDDAFVLRVASNLALTEAPDAKETAPVLARLAEDAQLIEDLLGKDYVRLQSYVKTLQRGAARGRTVDEILGDDQVRASFLHEVTGWATSYAAPTFSRDEKNLVKLQSFLSAKLPAA